MNSGFYRDIEPVPQTKAGTQKTDLRTLIGKGDGVNVFSMRVITIAPGGFIGMHSHPYEHEIFV
ncbi:MAG: cupin domain-containing protein, partial [bacterium]